MCLSRLYSWFCVYDYVHFRLRFQSNCYLKAVWAEGAKDETSHEMSKRIHAKCRKTGKVRKMKENKKSQSRKQISILRPFPNPNFNSERQKTTPQNYSLFRSASCWCVTKITNSSPTWLPKSWTELKKTWQEEFRKQLEENRKTTYSKN